MYSVGIDGACNRLVENVIGGANNPAASPALAIRGASHFALAEGLNEPLNGVQNGTSSSGAGSSFISLKRS
jgi:hypothetical protein